MIQIRFLLAPSKDHYQGCITRLFQSESESEVSAPPILIEEEGETSVNQARTNVNFDAILEAARVLKANLSSFCQSPRFVLDIWKSYCYWGFVLITICIVLLLAFAWDLFTNWQIRTKRPEGENTQNSAAGTPGIEPFPSKLSTVRE